jgi:hypothetical protein
MNMLGNGREAGIEMIYLFLLDLKSVSPPERGLPPGAKKAAAPEVLPGAFIKDIDTLFAVIKGGTPHTAA